MTSEAFKVVSVAQGSHKLAGQAFAALSTDLAAALWFGDGLVLVAGVGGRARGIAHAVGRERGGRRGTVVCGAAHEAVGGVGIIGELVVGALVVHRRRSLRWCAHVRLRQFRGWAVCSVGRETRSWQEPRGQRGCEDDEAVTVRGLADEGTCGDECRGRRECVQSGGVMGCGECEAVIVGWGGQVTGGSRAALEGRRAVVRGMRSV